MVMLSYTLSWTRAQMWQAILGDSPSYNRLTCLTSLNCDLLVKVAPVTILPLVPVPSAESAGKEPSFFPLSVTFITDTSAHTKLIQFVSLCIWGTAFHINVGGAMNLSIKNHWEGRELIGVAAVLSNTPKINTLYTKALLQSTMDTICHTKNTKLYIFFEAVATPTLNASAYSFSFGL